MKIFTTILLLIGFNAAALDLPLRLDGKTTQGVPCHLIIEAWTFNGGTAWYHIEARVRSSWQSDANPSLIARKSPTPFALFGSNKSTYDRIAINLSNQDLSPTGVENYSFQTYDESRGGLIQQYCRFN